MKIFLATEMGGTPFTFPYSVEIFKSHQFEIVNDKSATDVIVAHSLKSLLPSIVQFPKKRFLVWTNEPRFDTNFKKEIKFPFGLGKVDIMNVFGGEVFWHNLHFLSSYHFKSTNNLGIDINTVLKNVDVKSFDAFSKKNKIAALFTNTSNTRTRLIKAGINIDLNKSRCDLAIAGHQKGILDIYGNKWPTGYIVDNSGFGFEKGQPWWIEKLNILSGYKFNVCFENTAYPYYVTEKIWHAIVSYSLPIYSSFNSTIYDSFPKNSFIDADSFKNESDLLDCIENMDLDEYMQRLNLCIDVFNQSIKLKRDHYNTDSAEVTKKIIDRLAS